MVALNHPFPLSTDMMDSVIQNRRDTSTFAVTLRAVKLVFVRSFYNDFMFSATTNFLPSSTVLLDHLLMW